MNKTEEAYLRRAIRLVTEPDSRGKVAETLTSGEEGEHPIYVAIRDIVGDARFTAVMDDGNFNFWRYYSFFEVARFLVSLTEKEWADEDLWTEKKEEFLNVWFVNFVFPMTDRERRRFYLSLGKPFGAKKDTLRVYMQPESEILTADVTDMTAGGAEVAEPLPEDIREYDRMANKEAGRGGGGDPHQAEANFLKIIDPKIVELARLIGRRGASEAVSNGRFRAASRSDIAGVTVGNDLNSMLPSEVALLGSQATERVFYQRYARRRLQLFSSASGSIGLKEKRRGAVYICVDTSSSMSGEPEVTAKTLALAIAIVAQRENRPVFIINYSHSLSFFVLTDLRRQRRKLLRFLSMSYGGGNDEDMLFRFIFTQLPKLAEYSQFADTFVGADLLIVSDFAWMPLAGDVQEMIAKARCGGMRLCALGVDVDSDELDSLDSDEFGDGGIAFMSACEICYLWNDGIIRRYYKP